MGCLIHSINFEHSINFKDYRIIVPQLSPILTIEPVAKVLFKLALLKSVRQYSYLLLSVDTRIEIRHKGSYFTAKKSVFRTQ